MANRVLYPPVVASSLPAFLVSNGTLRVPISFSKFNNTEDFVSAQISIVKKDTGMNVVNTIDDTVNGRYRAAGIILNVPVLHSTVDGNTEYFVEIKSSDLSSIVGSYHGWIPGYFYKVQVRLSAANYSPSDGGQQAWLNLHASDFSEWSTVCIIKAIGDITLNLSTFNYIYRTSGQLNPAFETTGKSLVFAGKFSCVDVTETLAYYRLKIYDYPKTASSQPLDDSGYIYNTAVDINEFNYVFKNNGDAGDKFIVELEYNTINDFNEILTITYNLSRVVLDPIQAVVVSLDNDEHGILTNLTSLGEENDEGRIALKIYTPNDGNFTGTLCVRRTSSRTGFSVWEDVKIINVENQSINSLNMWYDYTIESGIWYKYGVQAINRNDERSRLNISDPVMRNFNYAYLLGENNQQLKLMFDNEMGNFTRQVSDSLTETLGGKYPVFSRNAALDYKQFPVNGLISFYMDDVNTFTEKKIVYNGTDIAALYENYNLENEIGHYDYIYEREFRKLVSDFLHDGKPKLFKSTTEGNIIVRLMNIDMTPMQEASRIVYSFSSTANEIAEDNVDNYKKYNLLILEKVKEV